MYSAKSNGHFSGFQLFTAVIKAHRLSFFFNLSGKRFPIVGSRNEKLSVP